MYFSTVCVEGIGVVKKIVLDNSVVNDVMAFCRDSESVFYSVSGCLLVVCIALKVSLELEFGANARLLSVMGVILAWSFIFLIVGLLFGLRYTIARNLVTAGIGRVCECSVPHHCVNIEYRELKGCKYLMYRVIGVKYAFNVQRGE